MRNGFSMGMCFFLLFFAAATAYPQTDDAYEDNDTQETAWPASGSWGVGCLADELGNRLLRALGNGPDTLRKK